MVANKRTANPVKKEDVRITRTKAALSCAFFNMLSEMPLEEITVNDLCERADVRRATFYKHFTDKGDFITFLIKDLRDNFDTQEWKIGLNPSLTVEYYTEYTKAVIDYLVQREKAMKNAVNSQMRATFIQTFVQQNYHDTIEHLSDSAESGMNLIASADVVASMLIGGLSHCIITWFESDERCSPEELLSDITKFIERVLG